MSNIIYRIFFFGGLILTTLSCNKVTTAPPVSGVAALNVVNATPNSNPVVPVINTGFPIMWFDGAATIGYGNSGEYSPLAGDDTIYVVQNDDTLNVNPKFSQFMYYSMLPLKKGGSYSLFLCGADTSAPDYLVTIDTLPYYPLLDSVVGIRFVNLSTGSGAFSVNLMGSAIGSVVENLPYKSVTGFAQYGCNSATTGYVFVVRDATSGDSLMEYGLTNINPSGYGLIDPVSGSLLVFRNITIAIYGSETNPNVPLSAMVIDNY